MFCGHVATLTHEKRENLGPAIRKNIIMEIVFTCCSAKISYHKNFRIYGTPLTRYCGAHPNDRYILLVTDIAKYKHTIVNYL